MISFLLLALTAVVSRWPTGSRRATAVLGLLAFGSVAHYFQGFALHGRDAEGRLQLVHWHDFGHYFLGAKYFSELGYDGLYVALLAAEGDGAAPEIDPPGEDASAPQPRMVRDLSDLRLVPAASQVASRLAVRSRFDAARWHAFTADAAALRARLGPSRYAAFLADHGFNVTPAWASLGAMLTHGASLASTPRVLALALLDPALSVFALLVVGRVFGARAALVGTVLLCNVFGAGFSWTGGALLRQLWLVAVLLGLCAVHRRSFALAGAAMALAAALRVFPLLWVTGLLAWFGWQLWDERLAGRCRPDPSPWRFAAGFCAASAALIGGSTWLYGPGAWTGFAANLRVYAGLEAANMVGLGHLARWSAQHLPGAGRLAGDAAVPLLRVSLAAAALAATVFLARRVDAVQAVALACPLFFVLLRMPAYYYVFLVVPVIAGRGRPRILTRVLAAEAASHLLALLTPSLAVAFVLRSLMLSVLFCELYLAAVEPGAERSPGEVADSVDAWPQVPAERQRMTDPSATCAQPD